MSNEKQRYFSSYHPIVNLLYFCFVIGFSMFLMHPVCLAASLLCCILSYLSKWQKVSGVIN